MTSGVLAATRLRRRERTLFLWSVVVAVAVWIGIALLFVAAVAEQPAVLAVPARVDARLVELPPPATPQVQQRKRPVRHVPPKPKSKPKARRTDTERPKPHRPAARAKPTPAPAAPPAHAARHPAAHEVMGARAVYSPLPRIPETLRDRAMQEEAVARLNIHRDGTVTAELVRPTLSPVINRIILETLNRWMFYPAIDHGRPVASVQEIRVEVHVGD
ncbi:MAG TPA: hypothetical protein VJ961_02595 [Mariprofundaceae bacterium]|nr:hypothetical protein [Mariprofundaceae bacterium]